MVRTSRSAPCGRAGTWPIRALVALALLATSLASIVPVGAQARDDIERVATITVNSFDCSADGETTDLPVFTEDACVPSDQAFEVTSPDGTTFPLQRITNDDGSVQRGPEAFDWEAEGESGTWSLTSLEPTDDTRFHHHTG